MATQPKSFEQLLKEDEALADLDGGFEVTQPFAEDETVAEFSEVDENGDLEITFMDKETAAEEEALEAEIQSVDHYANLAEFLDDSVLESIASDLLEKIEADDESRSDWMENVADGVSMLGLTMDDDDVAFEDACAATHPMLLEAITKFQSRAFIELFPAKGPVATKVMGAETPEKLAQAKRVKDFMNYQVLHMMPEYGPELDRLLFHVGFLGTAFKKTYFDPVLNRPTSRLVKPQDFIVPYSASDLQTSERYTHCLTLTKNDIIKYQQSGFYRDILIQEAIPETDDVEKAVDEIEGKSLSSPELMEEYEIYECHCVYDIPGFEDVDVESGEFTGVALPYIISIDKTSEKILAIKRNWLEEDPEKKKRLYFSDYHFIPGLGFYSYGYLHLIGGLAKSATSILRQLVDAGSFANLPAGFKLTGLRITGDAGPLHFGEFREVNATVDDIKKALMPLPFKEPSATLLNMLQFIIGAAEKFADSIEEVVQNASSYGPVGTILAMLEQSSKMFTAVQKRMHMGQSRDFHILSDINYEWIPDTYPFAAYGEEAFVSREDFDGTIDIIPVSDPNMPTQAHRIAKAQAIFSTAIQSPQLHNMRAILKEVYDSMEVSDPEKFLVPEKPQAMTGDPISENMVVLSGMPIQVRPDQDHESHVKVHASFMMQPANIENDMLRATMQSHIQDHIANDYRIKMQAALGAELPPPGQQMDPEMENQIAQAAAQVADSIKMTIGAAEAPPVDPTIELGYESLRVDLEKAKLDYDIDRAELELKRAKERREAVDHDLDRESREKVAVIQASNRGRPKEGK